VHLFLFIGHTTVQSPSQFCSSNRAPDLTPEQLEWLSQADINAASVTDTDEQNTPAQLGMRSQTKPDVPTYRNFDLNNSPEENEMNFHI